jgi:hypothetical protein
MSSEPYVRKTDGYIKFLDIPALMELKGRVDVWQQKIKTIELCECWPPHGFIVIETSDGKYYSVERLSAGILVRNSASKDEVKLRRAGEERDKVSTILTDNGRDTMADLYAWLKGDVGGRITLQGPEDTSHGFARRYFIRFSVPFHGFPVLPLPFN